MDAGNTDICIGIRGNLDVTERTFRYGTYDNYNIRICDSMLNDIDII